jgi:DNA-binding LacI/PurR family transcriptional regulator
MAQQPTALDTTSGGPLYQQLRQELFSRIRRGDFSPGARLPSENQLCETYGVSVTTARRALLELVKDGIVRRRPGVGTMVSPRVREAHLGLVSIDYRGDAWWATSAVMGELIAGIGELAWKRHASFSMSGVPEERASDYLASLVEARSVDGLLVRTANDIRPEHLDILERAGLPYVVLKRELPARPMNCVVSDDVLGARLATRHLIERGHRRIGFVCAKPSLSLTQERLSGYRQVLAEAGVSLDPALVRLELSFGKSAGDKAVRELLQSEPRPTAIFVASDTMAIGGYQAVRGLRLTIPRDVALVGYDDISPAAVLEPPLTTIRTAFEDFGCLGAQLLLDLIEGRLEPPQRVVIAPKLVVRQSTGKPLPRARLAPVAARPRGGALAARRIVLGGDVPPLADRLAAAVVDAGGEIMPSVAGHALDGAVWTVDLRQGLDGRLSAALAEVDQTAERMAQRLSGSVVLVGLCPDARDTATLAAAAAAGFKQLARTLSATWATRGVRINAVLARDGDADGIVMPCVFLLSEAAASLTGQTLSTGQAEGT